MRWRRKVSFENVNVQLKLSVDSDGSCRLSVRVPGRWASYREGAAAVRGPVVVLNNDQMTCDGPELTTLPILASVHCCLLSCLRRHGVKEDIWRGKVKGETRLTWAVQKCSISLEVLYKYPATFTFTFTKFI